MMRTINCRDDSLIEDRGMWTTMKRKKRCIIVAQGFFEWLKKNNGRDRIPHYIKRKDGQPMLLAGLWDCVKYEDSEEKLYTYTIITTDSNAQLKFLHDRMPVLLEAGSEAIRTWLDPHQTSWSKQLQSLLKPFQGELEIYPVNKEVGKVGNNSPSFIVPLDSKENKNNIANFFGNQKATAAKVAEKNAAAKAKSDEVDTIDGEPVKTVDDEKSTEDNAPKPEPVTESPSQGIKREHDEIEPAASSPVKKEKPTPTPSPAKPPAKKMRSATSNGSVAKSPSKPAGDGSKKITAFFGK